MNLKRTDNDSNSSQVGSRFLSSFSASSKPKSQFSQRANGCPPSKKPRLNIDKQLNLSGSITDKKDVNASVSITDKKASKETGDIYDDLWGDDPDSSVLEKVEFDTTQALSQMPDPLPRNNVQSNADFLSIESSTCKLPQSNQVVGLQSTIARGNINRLERVVKHSPRGISLRRTASSGWPSTQSYNDSNIKPIVKGGFEIRQYSSINVHQNDVEKLRVENEDLKDKLTKKAGEVNILRDRLISIQQESSKQKQDYIDKIEAIRQESEIQSARHSKELKSLKSQLDFKAVEIETAERRALHLNSVNRLQPDSPNRFRSTSGRSNFSPARANNKQLPREDLICSRSLRVKSCTLSLELLREIIIPELLKPTQPETAIFDPIRTITNACLFSGPGELRPSGNPGGLNLLRTANNVQEMFTTVKRQLSVPCPTMEQCSLHLLSSHLMDISSDNAHKIILKVLRTCLEILINQLNQLDGAVCPQNRYIEREREIVHCGYKYLMLTEDYNLLCCKELYNNERGICTRRALGLLSLLVEVSDFAAGQIVASHNSDQLNPKQSYDIAEALTIPCPTSSPLSSSDPQRILILLKDIIYQIEKQRNTLMFEGVLAGATALVRSLLQLNMSLSLQIQETIVHILRGVIFARPGSLVIHSILQALLAASKYPVITDSLCHNSVKKTFVENTRPSIITYTSDTCMLQVLCALIQLVETPKKHILSDVFTSWMLTLFYGVQQSPQWLFSIPSQKSCQCRPLISRLAFTLLGEACCVYSLDGSKEKKLLERLLTRGILLVCTLLYHDEHFGANIDPASVGFYELFLHSMNIFDMETKLTKACREILGDLCIQEALRQPVNTSDGQSNELNTLLNSLYCNQTLNKSRHVLDHLDSC